MNGEEGKTKQGGMQRGGDRHAHEDGANFYRLSLSSLHLRAQSIRSSHTSSCNGQKFISRFARLVAPTSVRQVSAHMNPINRHADVIG